MNKKELKQMISQKEGYNLEFKECYSDKIAKEICAFANATGGRILMGVDDNGSLVGINVTNRLKSQLQDLTRNFDPPVLIELEEVGGVLVVNVPEGANKPYSVNGKFYVRQGSNSQQLKRDEIREFFQKEGLVLFDEKLNLEFDPAKDIDEEVYKDFLRRTGITPVLERNDLLQNIGLLSNGYMKNAGVLLFNKDIGKFFRNATIMCALFQGTTKIKILDSKEFVLDLVSNYSSAITYIKSKLNTEFIIKGGPREEKLELPEEALREALLNSIAHRDYFKTANIQVYIFSDRVEIVNPGGLIGGMKISELGKKSAPRNHLLFGLMHRMDLIEMVGTGINRIRSAMKEYGLKPPQIDADADWFSIVFHRPDLQKDPFEGRTNGDLKSIGDVGVTGIEKWSEKWYDKWYEKWYEKGLTEREIGILVEIKRDPRISIKKLSDRIGINHSAIQRHIDKLKKKRIIKRVGPAKGGHWEIIREE